MSAALLENACTQCAEGQSNGTAHSEGLTRQMNGKIKIEPTITHVLPLGRINEGFDRKQAVKSIRAVVVC